MKPKITIRDLLIAALLVLVTWTLRGCFIKTPPNEDLIRAEMKIEALEEKRKSDSVQLSDYRQQRDEMITALKIKDTTLIIKYETTKIKYADIPGRINNLDRDSLRAAVHRYALLQN